MKAGVSYIHTQHKHVILTVSGKSIGVVFLRRATSSPSEQNGRHFSDDIFKCVFVNEKFVFQISPKFVHKGPIDNNPALV